MEQPTFFVVPTFEVVAELFLTFGPRFGEGSVRATVHPATGAFDHDDLGRHPLEQFAIVAHHQNRRLRREYLFLEPAAGGYVEVVVGFVEKKYIGTRREQEVEYESFAFTAREFGDESSGEVVDGSLHTAIGRRVPLGLELVATEIAPVGQCFGVAHSVVAAVG